MTDVPPEILDRPFADMRPFLEYTRWLGFRAESIVDVGANRGRWTEMALEVWPDAHCLLIEPQPEMREDLDALCARRPNVRWVEAGAGPEETELVQTIWDDLEGSSFLPVVDPERLAVGSQRPVRMRRLDESGRWTWWRLAFVRPPVRASLRIRCEAQWQCVLVAARLERGLAQPLEPGVCDDGS